MFCRRIFHVAFQQIPHHLADLVAHQVGRNAHYTVAARGHHVVGLVIVAAPHAEPVLGPVDDAGYLVHIAAGFLDADDIVDMTETNRRFVGHVETGAARHVV